MGKVVSVRQARTHLSRILAEVAGGAEVVIARAGMPVARLVPYELAPRRKRLGLLKGRIRVRADFNAPLPRAALLNFEGR
jgi:prevent-host-death family protein